MMEDHWDTRQEYIKLGNELAALDAKQEQDKKEQEKALKEMQEKMISVSYQANTVSNGEGELRPAFVPQKQENKSSSLESTPNQLPSNPGLTPDRSIGGELGGVKPLENRGRMGFGNNVQPATFQRPFGQNSNPFQNNNGRF